MALAYAESSDGSNNPFVLKTAICTDVGRVRMRNEDFALADSELGVLIVADGMGGHRAGDVASQTASHSVRDHLTPLLERDEVLPIELCLRMKKSIDVANRYIFDTASNHPELAKMGTTIAVGVLSNGKFYRAHAGDSPIYMYREGELSQLTKDHTLAQKMIDQGVFKSLEEAQKAGIGSNILTRALGLEEHIRVDLGDVKVKSGDIFFACSDGLSAVVSNNIIAQVIEKYGHDLELTAALLVRVAKEKGSRDNITVAIGRVEENTELQ